MHPFLVSSAFIVIPFLVEAGTRKSSFIGLSKASAWRTTGRTASTAISNHVHATLRKHCVCGFQHPIPVVLPQDPPYTYKA